MQTKKGLSFFGIVVALIVGSALYKQFDSALGTFKNTALAVIYIITLIFAVFLILRGLINKTEK